MRIIMSNTLSLARRIDQEAIKTTLTTRLSSISLTHPQAIAAMCINLLKKCFDKLPTKANQDNSSPLYWKAKERLPTDADLWQKFPRKPCQNNV